MKAQLIFLKDFYSPLHKKTFVAADSKNNSIEIDVDDVGVPILSFWYAQIEDDVKKEYFQLVTTNPKSKK